MFKNNPKAGQTADHPIFPPISTERSGPSSSPDTYHDELSSSRADNQPKQKAPRHRFLTPAEWSILAHGVGGVKDSEGNAPVHPTSWLWPPKGLPPGLYKDVILLRTQSFYRFHFASTVRWGLMILQLLLGATLTALGSFADWDGTSVTVLGALNTIVAGVLALIHNSGIPDRYRNDMAEFEEVEDHIKQMLETGIVPYGKGIDQALTECYDLFHEAKATVASNMPVAYNPSQFLQSDRRSIVMVPQPPVSPTGHPRVQGDAGSISPPTNGK